MMRKMGLEGNVIQKLLALYIIVWIISPPLQYGGLIRLSVLGSAALWFLTVISSSSFRIPKVYAAVILFAITATLILLMSGYNLYSALTHNLQALMILLCLCMFLYYYSNEEYLFLVFCANVAVCLFALWSSLTLVEYQVNPGVSRLLVKSSDYAMAYARRGIGGYGLVYSMVYITSTMLYAVKKENKLVKKLIYLGVFMIGAVLVFQSGYLISCLLLMVSIICFFLGLFNDTRVSRIIITLAIVFSVALLFEQFFIEHADQIISFFDGTMYKQKISDILQTLSTDETTGKVGARTDRYYASLVAAVKYFIPGAYILNKYEEVGGHSVLLDIIASYGLLGSFGFYYSLFAGMKSVADSFKNNGFVYIMLILLFLNGILNNYAGAYGVAVFIVLTGFLVKYDIAEW